ncbi:hypothetical protein [Campylobacter majalis]|uniref:hypothetical protein n=1 Tax=Campylobacter majalis TaxID=2790656 RepID=UPI003D689814
MKKFLLLIICFLDIYADVCDGYHSKMLFLMDERIKSFTQKYENIGDDNLWHKAVNKCENSKEEQVKIPACLYVYKNFMKQPVENIKNVKIYDILIDIIETYTKERLRYKDTKDEAFYNYQLIMATKDIQTILKLLFEGKAIDDEQFNALNDFFNATISVHTLDYCPLIYDPTLNPSFIPSDEIKDPCLCYIQLSFVFKEKEYVKFAKLSEILCEKYKNAPSCISAGVAYKTGTGVRYSLKKAKEYFGLACDYGGQDGCDKFKELSR